MNLLQFSEKLVARDLPLHWPGHWIGGSWRREGGGARKTSHNPNDGKPLIEVQLDKAAVEKAIEAAQAARKPLCDMDLTQRLEILDRFRQTLADFSEATKLCLRLEAGKPLWEAENDFDSALNYLDWVAKGGSNIFDSLLAPARLGRCDGSFQLQPIGITAAYIPFSTPLTSFVFYFSAAMLAGCPLILSSSSHAILSSMMFGLVSEHMDLPKGALNVIFGNFNGFRQLVGDSRVAAIIYTGSREHSESIRGDSKPRLGRQLILQSGGKNAVIVHSSADLDQAVKCVLYGALKSAGQRCSSTSRVFVYRSLLNEFKERMREAFKQVPIGRTDIDYDSPDHAPFMGPVYSQKSVEKFLRFQTMANREASQTLLWGKTVESEDGFFVTPGLHYLEKFDNSSAYQGNVLFSPDVAIYDYDVLDEAIEKINTTDAAFVVSFMGDPEIINSRRSLFLAPNLFVNLPTVETEATLPLAGRLQSGHHRFHGPGVALYLCYPQVLDADPEVRKQLHDWPWPKFDR